MDQQQTTEIFKEIEKKETKQKNACKAFKLKA